jgi:hypothetical protein
MQEVGGDPVATDTGGEYKVDTQWDWQPIHIEDGKGVQTDGQLINVTHRDVTIGGTTYDEVRRAWHTRDFRIEVRKKGTDKVLKTQEWGYKWNNDNAVWTPQDNPPAPDLSCCRAGKGSGQFEDVYGISGLPWF